MIRAAAALFQRDGYDATSWRKLVDEAGSPWGSTYHHFPGGKEELAVAALAYGGDAVAGAITSCFERHQDAGDAIEAWFRAAAKELRRSDYSRGCRVATVALETIPDSAPITAAVRDAFDRWRELLTTNLVRSGIAEGPATDLAVFALTSIEGALLVSRVWASTDPLTRAGSHVAALVRAAQQPGP